MISILVSWIFITIIFYCIGNSVHHLITIIVPGNPPVLHFSLLCFTGLMACIFFTTLVSLFMPLGLNALLLLIALTAFCIVVSRGFLLTGILFNRAALKKIPWSYVVLGVLFVFIICYISYLPSSHYDDGLYYSTSIRWLQEYGTVKGLVNINSRIAFNSSWFNLCALFGFPFLKIGLLNDMNGLLFLYVFIYSLGGIFNLWKGNTSLPMILRAIFFLPVLAFYRGASDEFSIFNMNLLESVSVDLPVCLITWLIFLLFLEASINRENSQDQKYLLVIFYSIVAVTIKITVIPALVLTIYILFKYAIKKKFLKIIFIVFTGLILVLPWVIRNIFISGYLIFPFSKLDLINVPWKMPLEYVKGQENMIMIAAADVNHDYSKNFTQSITEWLKPWFLHLNYMQSVFFCWLVLNTFVFLLISFYQALKRNFIFFLINRVYIVFIIACLAGILLWLFKGPDFRFGYGFIGIYCLFSVALFLKYFLENKVSLTGALAFVFIAYIGTVYYSPEIKAIPRNLFKPPLSYRMPEHIYDTIINNSQVLHIVDHGDSWNAPLPVSNKSEYGLFRPVLLGKTVKEGYKPSFGK